VRVISINEETKGERPTYLLTHGFMSGSAMQGKIVKQLSNHYHLVLFDNTTWGLNERDGDDTSCTGAEGAEKFMLSITEQMVEGLVERGTIPEKFFLSGHSFGGYIAGLYASQHPERIAALLMVSPMGSSYVPENFTPCSVQNAGDTSKLFTAKEIKQMEDMEQAGTSHVELLRKFPECLLGPAIGIAAA
jgi:pimeloyl-ACP methyl ester carboxylesterase